MHRRIGTFILVALIALLILAGNRSTLSENFNDEWWNSSWNFRFKIEVNTGNYSRTDWPVEYAVNFTNILLNLNESGTFDNNSIRVIEYNLSGSALHEVISQFDPRESYNSSANAAGDLIFLLNGTTPNQTTRYFYVYFDVLENGQKPTRTYTTELSSSWDGKEFVINTTLNYTFYFDTARGENTSGLYKADYQDGVDRSNYFTPSSAAERTREWTQITDGVYNYTFDFRYNATITAGPLRIRVRQYGNEVYWNDFQNRTNRSMAIKTYTFYFNHTWYLLHHNITNTANHTIYRHAVTGLPRFDALNAYGSTYKITYDYSTDPGSWVFANYQTGGRLTAVINVNESVQSMTADNSTSLGTIGITFQNATLQPNQSISELSAFVFGLYQESIVVQETRDRLINPVALNISPAEQLSIAVESRTEYPVYNRNETIIITGNVTFDPWNVVYYMNATLDRGTQNSSDDIEIPLYDDGTHGDAQAGDNVFTNTYSLNSSENTGQWTLVIRQYDYNRHYINESSYAFNITSQLHANLTILNPTGLPRIANATLNLTNFREDSPIAGASVNCSTNGAQIPQSNITDNSDGTYQIIFSTPSEYGLYNLSCVAQKDGNAGSDEQNYTVEAPTTNLSLLLQPNYYIAYNVSWEGNESFVLRLTINNTWKSNSYNTNITLLSPAQIQPNVTSDTCGTIAISTQCVKDFLITVLNSTSPENYTLTINVNWTNLDSSLGSNTTSMNITVRSNPILSVVEDNITGIIAPGNDTVIAGFTVYSSGNDVLNSTNFSVYGLDQFGITFIPPNISSLNAGQTQSIDVNVYAPANQSPGIYNGTINVTSSNGGYYELPFTITVTGTNMSVSAEPQYFSSYNVTWYTNESFLLSVNTTNIGNTTAFYVYINISLPQNWSSNGTSLFCGNLSKGGYCESDFNITIASGTRAGNYTINSTIYWEDIRIGRKSNTSTTSVHVVQNVTMETDRTYINSTLQHGTSAIIGNFTLISSGNDAVYNITFNLTGLENMTIEFSPQNISSLPVGSAQTVNVTATIEKGFPPGNYSGTVNISSSNDGFSLLYINIDVPENGSWEINSTYCEHIEEPASGTACTILINNTGNIDLNFTINQSSASPQSGENLTWPDRENFTIEKQNSTVINILYDITGEPKIYYNYTYNISAHHVSAEPQFVLYNLILNPYVKPNVSISLDPSQIEQGGSLTIWATVNSLSGANINTVVANVTQPNGVSTNATMWLYQSGNPSVWVAYYPTDAIYGTWGNTTLRGNYTVEVSAFDDYGMNGSSNTTFNAYTKLVVSLNTGTSEYEQGETASLNYRVAELSGEPLSNTTVNLVVKNSNQETIYNKTLVTNQYGRFDTLESLTIPSDAVTGTYTLISHSSYFDSDASRTVQNTSTSTFEVIESGGLISHIQTAVVWYPESTMTFGVNIYDSRGNPVDPDSMNLTVYVGSPALNNIYFSYNLNDSIFQRQEEGFYILSYVMPANTSPGDYWAVLRAAKGNLYTLRNHPFRVATGGPYDVIIDYIDPEVEQGSYLNFRVIIENMGEYGQDVDVDYWITDSSGEEWSRESAAVFTPSGQNVTFDNNLFIFSSQPTGLYTFHVKVTYSNLQDPIEKTATFSVIPMQAAQPPEEQPAGGGVQPEAPSAGPTPPPPVPDMEIEYFPDEIAVEAGVSRFINIKLNNIGNADIHNITFSIQGITPDWYEFEPETIGVLKKDDSLTVILKITVPGGTKKGDHSAKLIVKSTQKTIEEPFTLFVFTSRKELAEFELARLIAKTSDLEEKAKKAELSGKDMTKVFEKIDEIKEQIKTARDHLDNDRVDAALTAIYTGWKLYREALYLYEHAESRFEIPWWLLLIIIIAVVVVAILFLLRKLYVTMKAIIRGRISETRIAEPRLSEVKEVITSMKKESAEVENLRNQISKLRRTLDLLESQRNQKIISQEAYTSMKKSTEEKISKLEEKIRNLLKS